MKIIQSPLFSRKIKKLHKNKKEALDDEIELVLENPKIGQEKKGDIKGIYVHKFSMINTQYLLSYRFNEDELELITIGPLPISLIPCHVFRSKPCHFPWS